MNNLYLIQVFSAGLSKIGVENFQTKFELPKNPEHGDLSTNLAMQLSKELKLAPRAISEKLIANLEYDKELIELIDIAGPGFINIKFTKSYYHSLLKSVIAKGNEYGKTNIGDNKKVNVEYVSANPTGLLHLGHGRNAATGDTIANLYKWCGWDVTREYYFNNGGNQMTNLAKSIYARYMQLQGKIDFPFPDDGYHGEYVKTIAQEIFEKDGNKYLHGNSEDLEVLKKYGENWCFDKIKKTLKAMKIDQDVYYNEDTLYSSGKIEDVLALLKDKGLSYEKDGATWLKLCEMGMETDRVIVKSTGEPTYRLPDIAYHIEKFRRGFEILVDVFGADHIATIPDVMACLKALGYESDRIKVIIHQFVTLTENGVQVKMSKRTGKSYTLDELVDEVGADVVRFFFIMRGISTHLEFDLALAREQSDKNPVFYLQYAHARICSVFDNLKEKSIEVNLDQLLTESDSFTNLLDTIYEINLIKQILLFEDEIKLACQKQEPHILAEYLKQLANSFHSFYHECRIIGVEENLMKARLILANTARTTLSNGLKILGISAPERM